MNDFLKGNTSTGKSCFTLNIPL